MKDRQQTIFNHSQEGQKAYSLPRSDPAFEAFSPEPALQRGEPAALPEVSELDLTRHFCRLSKKNMGIDTVFYPLGSCTMKLNPRINELCAALPSFQRIHPLTPDKDAQGCLKLAYDLVRKLCSICGMHEGSLAPNAGAQGEFVGLQMIKAYHRAQGDFQRTELLIPDDAHGTNPASATMAGFKTVAVRTDAQGDCDLEQVRRLLSERTAGLMLTNPSTLGLFHSNITELTKMVHEAGGLLYYDGANLNAILNICRPGDMGFDVMHLNLHKTFSTPHGGGGPGSGPVLCNQKLSPYLPTPRVIQEEGRYRTLWDAPHSIGKIASFYGNFGIYLRAYTYILLHGHYGLRRIAEGAILNANYLKKRLSTLFPIPYKQACMHEFVVQADTLLEQGVRAYDLAKRLLDYGIHAPTIYFPLIIKECMLIEPTESESLETLDRFVEVLERILDEARNDPEFVRQAPHTTSVRRLDEVQAARHPCVCFWNEVES